VVDSIICSEYYTGFAAAFIIVFNIKAY